MSPYLKGAGALALVLLVTALWVSRRQLGSSRARVDEYAACLREKGRQLQAVAAERDMQAEAAREWQRAAQEQAARATRAFDEARRQREDFLAKWEARKAATPAPTTDPEILDWAATEGLALQRAAKGKIQ